MKKAITYYRVSTERQGINGLGLDAQKKAVRDFANANDFMLANEYIEIESGKRNARPLLQQALTACIEQKATLLIAKLDRLGRNVAFISKLLEAGVDFKAVDNPYAGKLIVHIMAAFAEHERDQISERTIVALRAAKARGVSLGKYGRDVLSKVNETKAEAFAKSIEPTIEKLQGNGHTTIRDIMNELNRLQIPTYRNNGQKWHVSTVHSVMSRLNNINTSSSNQSNI